MSGADVAIKAASGRTGSCRETKTEIVHVVGECDGVCASWPLCRRASISS